MQKHKQMWQPMLMTQAADLIRTRFIVHERTTENEIKLGTQTLINFSSNDYLAIASHEVVKKAFIDGVQQYGFGSGSSAMVSGFYNPHRQLEKRFAEFLQRGDAILFNSGYLANI